MAGKKNWEKLAGEEGEAIPSGRFGRMVRLGGLGLSVGASTVAGAVARRIVPGAARGERSAADVRRLERNAEKVVKVLGRMKGASMKIGQILSADPDMVPPEFAEVLTTLQHAAPPMTWATVQRQIEGALDQPISSVFRFFDHEPVGAASIGQVHRATLLSGEDVAVKVQYPGVVDSLDSDLKNMASLMTLGRAVVDRKRLDDYLGEVRKAVLEEADYTLEAANLRRAVSSFAGREGVRVPRPYEALSRPTVLVMEYIAGQKLDEAILAMGEGPRRSALLERFLANYVWMFHELGELHSDPHPGNFLLDADDNLVVLDFGCVRVYEPAFPDGILRILIACWEDDDEGAARLYRELRFGKDAADEDIYDPQMIREYHEIILAPFLEDREFDFGEWPVREQLQRWVWRNPKFLKLVPPPESVMYLRVLSGIKGLLMKAGARFNTHRLAVETAKRRGLY
jgi:predicted unusual protein kinase regulating ubiquinone biosynthesis (AarF/ABC1/UbiB family)